MAKNAPTKFSEGGFCGQFSILWIFDQTASHGGESQPEFFAIFLTQVVDHAKMTKLMQKIVIFIEPTYAAYETPTKIGNIFMNRFAIDEDAEIEILKICYLEHNLLELTNSDFTPEEGLDSIL